MACGMGNNSENVTRVADIWITSNYIVIFGLFQASDPDTVADMGKLTYDVVNISVVDQGNMGTVPPNGFKIETLAVGNGTIGQIYLECAFDDTMKGYVLINAIVYDDEKLHNDIVPVTVNHRKHHYDCTDYCKY